eukprot:scaffold3284_cov207-Pinguiococcus_pyrenoidosus.AAC.1
MVPNSIAADGVSFSHCFPPFPHLVEVSAKSERSLAVKAVERIARVRRALALLPNARLRVGAVQGHPVCAQTGGKPLVVWTRDVGKYRPKPTILVLVGGVGARQ